MSCFTTVGLHRLPPSPAVTPLSEYRSNLSSYLYFLDKNEALFLARPPHLIRHYCTYRMPLDLSEEELYNGPEVLAAAVSKLDANGWNTSGAIHTITWSRARCSLIPFGEQILEMTLGVNTHCSSSDLE
jgi:hypothetical protein